MSFLKFAFLWALSLIPCTLSLYCSTQYGNYIDYVDGESSFVRIRATVFREEFEFVSLVSSNTAGQVGTVGNLEVTRIINLDSGEDIELGVSYETLYFDIEFNFDCTPLLDCVNSGVGNGTESVTLTVFNTVDQVNETCTFDLEGVLSMFICTPSFNFDYVDNTTTQYEITLYTLDGSDFEVTSTAGSGGGNGHANYTSSSYFDFDINDVIQYQGTYCSPTTIITEFRYDCTPLSVCRQLNAQPDRNSYSLGVDVGGKNYGCDMWFVGSLDDPPTNAPTMIPTSSPITELEDCIQTYQDCVIDCETEATCAEERTCTVTCGQNLQMCQDERLGCPPPKGKGR